MPEGEAMMEEEKRRAVAAGKAFMALLILLPLVVLLLLPAERTTFASVDEQVLVARLEEYKKLIDAKGQKNLNPERPDASHLRTLDFSIKRNTTVIKKLKMIIHEQKDGLMEELKSVDLIKFVSEAVSHICEVKLRSAHMQANVQSLHTMEPENAKFLNAKGELSDENTTLYEKLRKSFDQLLRCVSSLAEALDTQPPVMPDDGHTRLNTGTELSPSGKDFSAFYESDLRVFVPVVLLGEAEPKLVYQEGEPFENTCGISDVFGNREYPVANGKAIHYSKSELIGLAEVVLFTILAGLYLHKKLWIGVPLVLLACTHVQSVPAALPDIESLNFGDSYDTFFNLMHGYLEANTQAVRGHYILPPEMDMNDPNIPSRWIGVEVTGDDGVAIMYFRADTIYLVGFMNSAGTLYCTDDAVDFFPIAGCTRLGFKSNYHDLTERPSKSVDLGLFMQEALLGSEGAKIAANVLAMYGVNIFEESAVKNAMLAYSIMIAEAMRFKPIRDLVRDNWEHSTVLPKELCNLVFVWQDLSILWCRGDRTTEDEPEWNRAIERLDKANIRNEQDVDRALDLVKYEKPCKDLRIENP